MAVTTYRQAAIDGLAGELERDPRVWALGEDIGRGGTYGQYGDLAERFPERIVSTPISEATIMGAGVGAALVGTRPVVELRAVDFALCAVDEMINQAAKARYMFGGQARCPVVIRQATGLRSSTAAQHSQSFEAWYVHVPGLVVLAPATPADNKGLLAAAVRCDDPVIYLESKSLWDAEGEVPDGDHETPIGQARIAREGGDATIVTWSGALPPVEQAAEAAAAKGIAVDVIDLRSLWPWDEEAVLASVEKTGRLIIAHEAVQVGGFGAEISATVAEKIGHRLKAPVRRFGAPRIPVPFSPPLEEVCKVQVDGIVAALEAMA